MGKGSRNRAAKSQKRAGVREKKRAQSVLAKYGADEKVKVPIWDYPTYAVELAQRNEADGGEPVSADAVLDALMWVPAVTDSGDAVEVEPPMEEALWLGFTRDEYLVWISRVPERGLGKWDPENRQHIIVDVHPDGTECDCSTWVCKHYPEQEVPLIYSVEEWVAGAGQ